MGFVSLSFFRSLFPSGKVFYTPKGPGSLFDLFFESLKEGTIQEHGRPGTGVVPGTHSFFMKVMSSRIRHGLSAYGPPG